METEIFWTAGNGDKVEIQYQGGFGYTVRVNGRAECWNLPNRACAMSQADSYGLSPFAALASEVR